MALTTACGQQATSTPAADAAVANADAGAGSADALRPLAEASAQTQCTALGATGERVVDRFDATGFVIYNPFLQLAAAGERAALVVRQRTEALDELRLTLVDMSGGTIAAPRQLDALPDHDSEYAELRAVGDRFAIFWNEARDEPADAEFTVYQYYALYDADGAPVVEPTSLGQWWASAKPAVTPQGKIGVAVGQLDDWATTREARLSLSLIDDPAAPALAGARTLLAPYTGAAYRLIWQQARQRFVLLLQREEDDRIVLLPISADGEPGSQRDTGVAGRIARVAVTADGHLALLRRVDQGSAAQPASELQLQVFSPELEPLAATTIDRRAEHDALELVAEDDQLVAFWAAPTNSTDPSAPSSRLFARRFSSRGEALDEAAPVFDYRPFFADRLAVASFGQGRFGCAWLGLDEAAGGYALTYRAVCLP